MSNCGSRPKKMKYGGKVKKMARGGMASDADMARVEAIMGEMSNTISDADRAKLNMMNMTGSSNTISDADREALNALIGEISGGGRKSVPTPARMPKKIRNMRQRRMSRGGAGEAGSAVTRYENGGCVMAGRGGKFKGIS